METRKFQPDGKVKLLLVTGSYPSMRCGVGDYTQCLAEALAARDDVALRVLTSQSAAAAAGDPPWLERSMRDWRLESLGPYLRLLRAYRPDVVHVQYPTQGYSVATGPVAVPTLAHMHGAFVVQTWHEYPQSPLRKVRTAMLVLAASADALVYVRPDYPAHLHGLTARLLGRAARHFVPNASVVPTVELSESERAAARRELGGGERKLVAFFGFAYPHKGVHRLFEICDPQRHQLVLIGPLEEGNPYHREVQRLAGSEPWRGRVTLAGFVDAARAARLLACADAAVFPFLDGGGSWNTSVHAAMTQGTFTLMTSRERSGYVAAENLYAASPDDTAGMRQALVTYAGVRVAAKADDWNAIAEAHARIYRQLSERLQGRRAR